MRIIDPGHKYELEGVYQAGYESKIQTIQFLKKQSQRKSDSDPIKLITVEVGTTNEEILEMLIDRMNFLQMKASCRENAIAITKLEESLMWLKKRTADRIKRGVEGTNSK